MVIHFLLVQIIRFNFDYNPIRIDHMILSILASSNDEANKSKHCNYQRASFQKNYFIRNFGIEIIHFCFIKSCLILQNFVFEHFILKIILRTTLCSEELDILGVTDYHYFSLSYHLR